ncbi:MAG TPA: hypothetical protein VGF95_03325 [Solirubrobacteraceae bacterium]
MSSLIQPAVQGPAASGAAAPLRASGATSASAPQNPIASVDEPVSLDTVPSTPPPEVLAQMQEAGTSYEALQAKGYEVHYSEDSGSRRMGAELRDAEGSLVRALTPSEAVELAAGAPLGDQ